MNTYELFFILPGTLTETEVKPAVGEVIKIVTEAGGREPKAQDLGKSRLAYPMRQIRYGYFEICHFQAEPGAVPALQAKLSVMTNVLRVLVRQVKSAPMAMEKISVVCDVFSREPGEVVREGAAHIFASQEAVAHRVDRAVKPEAVLSKPSAPVETKASEVKLDDIDKKLDELLQGDIAEV